MQYEYGGAYRDYPVDGAHIFPDGSTLAVQSVLSGMPDWMQNADLLFCDPPWNESNLKSFYTKNGQPPEADYTTFFNALFAAIRSISPRTAYVEIGKDHLADVISEMRIRYDHVTFYNSTYYHKPDNLCYVVRGSKSRRRAPKLDGMDEEDIIRWVCENEDYSCIADPCIGQGLVALYASRAGKRFVGTDINARRLAVARKRVETGKR